MPVAPATVVKCVRVLGTFIKEKPAVPSVNAVLGATPGVHSAANTPGTWAIGANLLLDVVAMSAQYWAESSATDVDA